MMHIKTPHELHKELQGIYESLGLLCSNFSAEKESQEYGACTFEVSGKRVICRVAKITPTKSGQFVTFWKRENSAGPIMPYDITDQFDFFVVHVYEKKRLVNLFFLSMFSVSKGMYQKMARVASVLCACTRRGIAQKVNKPKKHKHGRGIIFLLSR